MYVFTWAVRRYCQTDPEAALQQLQSLVACKQARCQDGPEAGKVMIDTVKKANPLFFFFLVHHSLQYVPGVICPFSDILLPRTTRLTKGFMLPKLGDGGHARNHPCSTPRASREHFDPFESKCWASVTDSKLPHYNRQPKQCSSYTHAAQRSLLRDFVVPCTP